MALDTKKLLTHIVEGGGTTIVTIHDLGTLPYTLNTYDENVVKSDYVCVKSELSNPYAQLADWKVITGNGSITIDVAKENPTDEDRENAIVGLTDITLYLNPTNSKGKATTVVVNVSSFSSLPKTVTDSNITSDHVCIKSVLSNPSAQTADWKVITSSDSSNNVTIDANYSSPTTEQRAAAISDSTTATLYFTKKK